MSATAPPYKITDKILKYISSISEKIGRISEVKNLDSKPHLRRNNKIKSIHSSLKIEANSLSLGEVRDVIGGRAVLGSRNEIQEVKNAYEAYEKISFVDPYSVDDLKKLHGVMTRYLVSESGEFRKGEEGVFNGDKCIFMAPPARFVEEEIANLFSWMQENKDVVHPLILSAVFHYEFVFIHPFADGNGRMARLWHSAILLNWKPIFEFIPIESQIEKFQDGYYKAISDCHIDGESTKFIEFILEQIDSCLDEILNQTDLYGEEYTEYVKLLLSVMEYDVPYTSKAILELLNLKSKETLRKNYLNPAIEMGLIAKTIPDKPNSRNQRYIKR